MAGQRIDYGSERQRHEGFVGRAALLVRLDEHLTADALGGDNWVQHGRAQREGGEVVLA